MPAVGHAFVFQETGQAWMKSEAPTLQLAFDKVGLYGSSAGSLGHPGLIDRVQLGMFEIAQGVLGEMGGQW